MRGGTLPRGLPAAPALAGRRLHALANPFEALANLETTGYATLEYTT